MKSKTAVSRFLGFLFLAIYVVMFSGCEKSVNSAPEEKDKVIRKPAVSGMF